VRTRLTRGAALSILALLAAPADAAEPVAPSRHDVRVRFESGYAVGIDVNRGIRKADWRGGVDYRWSPAFSTGAEVALVHFVGRRGGRPVDTFGVTVLPLVRWSFVRTGSFACSFDAGLGLALFGDGFPPGGTQLNGYSTFGLAIEHALTDRVALLGGVRAIHHSNGRGFVDDNPAFDGVAIHLGAGARPGQ
jgi:hypothetical protein